MYDAGSKGKIRETEKNIIAAERRTIVYSLCSHNGKLYDAGHYRKIFETKNNKIVVEREDYLAALCTLNGKLYDAGEYGIVETETGKRIVENKTIRAMCSISSELVKQILERRNA